MHAQQFYRCIKFSFIPRQCVVARKREIQLNLNLTVIQNSLPIACAWIHIHHTRIAALKFEDFGHNIVTIVLTFGTLSALRRHWQLSSNRFDV